MVKIGRQELNAILWNVSKSDQSQHACVCMFVRVCISEFRIVTEEQRPAVTEQTVMFLCWLVLLIAWVTAVLHSGHPGRKLDANK